MSHVVINALTVPTDRADELAGRFAARAGMVEGADGFERFELLRPADGREQWLVVTTWRDQAAFQAWMSSAAFGGAAHSARAAGSGEPSARAAGSGEPSARAAGSGEPVSTASEIWTFSVEQQAVAP